jgi:hypothetical protein
MRKRQTNTTATIDTACSTCITTCGIDKHCVNIGENNIKSFWLIDNVEQINARVKPLQVEDGNSGCLNITFDCAHSDAGFSERARLKTKCTTNICNSLNAEAS